MDNNPVVWCWSLNEPNILFIFRIGGQELRIDLTRIGDKTRMQNSVLFLKEETELLINLLQELKQIK